MADFEYFRAEESDQFSFFRIPKALFTEKEFASLSTDAKLLYGILLDRISLSKKNGWIDGDGYVYIIYTIAELQELLRMSHTTVTKLLYELDSVHGIGLIERYRQGNNRPSVIYVKNFVKRIRGKPVRYFASETPETGNPDCKELEIRIARNWKSGTQKNRSPDCKNLDGSNTKINKTEKNHTDKSKGNTPALEEKGVKEKREQQVAEKNESREAVPRSGVDENTGVKDAGKAERKAVAQKKAMPGKEKKPSIHERLEINKRIIQEKQGKDKPERGADLGVR